MSLWQALVPMCLCFRGRCTPAMNRYAFLCYCLFQFKPIPLCLLISSTAFSLTEWPCLCGDEEYWWYGVLASCLVWLGCFMCNWIYLLSVWVTVIAEITAEMIENVLILFLSDLPFMLSILCSFVLRLQRVEDPSLTKPLSTGDSVLLLCRVGNGERYWMEDAHQQSRPYVPFVVLEQCHLCWNFLDICRRLEHDCIFRYRVIY